MFASCEKQIERVKEWNEDFDWRIPEEQFRSAVQQTPAWPKGELVVPTLVPYLSREDATFSALWRCAAGRQKMSEAWKGYGDWWDNRISLLPSIQHPVPQEGSTALRWEVLELGRLQGRRPIDYQSDRSPHAGVLAAAALHPRWIRAMDGVDVPYVYVPGYCLRALIDGRRHELVPTLFGGSHQLRLSHRVPTEGDPKWAIPTVAPSET